MLDKRETKRTKSDKVKTTVRRKDGDIKKLSLPKKDFITALKRVSKPTKPASKPSKT